MFGDDAARVVVFVKAFQPYGVSFVSSRTVTRYVTQVKNNISKIAAFLGATPWVPLPAGIRAALRHGWPAPSKCRTWPGAQIAAKQFRSVANLPFVDGN